MVLNAVYWVLAAALSIFTKAQVQIPNGYVPGKECERACEGTAKRCFYHFRVENVRSMSKACFDCPTNINDCFRPDCIVAGGIERTLVLANRQLPGPAIRVCLGDTVMVAAENALLDGGSMSLHWHGLLQASSPYMDGVPFVTQCPVVSNNMFQYEFRVDQYGTYFWHAHSKFQRGEGLYGAFIVNRSLAQEPYANQYDADLPEHVLIITDFARKSMLDMYEDYKMTAAKTLPDGILINGLGYLPGNTKTPLYKVNVEKGKRYRIRLIDTAFVDCAIEISITNHSMTVIAADGADTKPQKVTSLIMNSGERYDIIINADQPVDAYWIRFKGYNSCANNKVIGIAVLLYIGAKSTLPVGPVPTYENSVNRSDGALLLNPVTLEDSPKNTISVAQLQGLTNVTDKLRAAKVNKQFCLSLDFSSIDSPDANRKGLYGYAEVSEPLRKKVAQINHISHKVPSVPFLPERSQFKSKDFCSVDTINSTCEQEYCECMHVLEVRKGDSVEMILIEPNAQDNPLPTYHPMHLHGYKFHVVSWGFLNGTDLTCADVTSLDNNNQLKRNYDYSPSKDTVSVPKGGYVILRFIANNPGFWLFHCHIETHVADGMELVLKVGKDREMPNAPKNFPKCGNYP